MKLVAAVVLAVALVIAACGDDDEATSTPAPTATPTTAATPTSDAGTQPVVVTFEVVGVEQYKVLLTDPEDIAIARALLANEEAPRIPNGKVVRGDPGVNTGYSWHIDPDDIEFVDVAMEVCDGRPSDVEAGTITSDRYCPWDARVIAIDPAP